jgi:hypothetical protein
MKVVVTVSPGELVRIVALAVLARPENLGKVCASVELAGQLESASVILFDTPKAAMDYVAAGPQDRSNVIALVRSARDLRDPASDPP